MTKRYLMIVESPGKIRKLKKILGPDYVFMASMGHVVDLPRKSFGIDVAQMEPQYEVIKPDVAKRLRAEAKKSYAAIYLAADPDREGEAIAHHVETILRKARTKAPIKRITFDAITQTAVRAGLSQERSVDRDLVNAQEARRMLDRLVGYPASRFLWAEIDGKGLSAGRVQSVALRLVTEREQTITTFVPREYRTIIGHFSVEGGRFEAKLHRWQDKDVAIATETEAKTILAALKGVAYTIVSVKARERTQKPPPPFVTSTLQQAASSHLKLSPERTMALAQKLYENGLITYMRTDSPGVSPEGQSLAHTYITEQFGPDYIGHHRYGSKADAQEAHECIRPTETIHMAHEVALSVGEDQAGELYELIARRFLASQAASARHHDVVAAIRGGDALFAARGSTLLFDGFKRIYDLSEEQDQAEDTDAPVPGQLPPLAKDQPAQALALTPEQHWTRPPNRYSEALLIRAMERAGVGRPSTYAATIATLKKRKYVEVKKRSLRPTPLGAEVTRVLTERLPDLFAVRFTAAMETALDEIAAGKRDGRVYLQGFWDMAAPAFGERVVRETIKSGTSSNKAKPVSKNTGDPALGPCPKCDKPLITRSGKHGSFVGCTAFPKCRYTRKVIPQV